MNKRPCQSMGIVEGLFGCTHVHFNQRVLEWIGVEIKLSSIPIHSNTHGTWIEVDTSDKA